MSDIKQLKHEAFLAAIAELKEEYASNIPILKKIMKYEQYETPKIKC